MIVFTCPHCGKNLQVHDKLAGQTGSCKGCGKLVQAPAAPPPVASAPPPPPQFQAPQSQDAGIVPGAAVPPPEAQSSSPWAQLENMQIDVSPTPPPHIATPGGYGGGGASGEYAGFWLRLVACIIDFVIMVVPVGVVGFLFGLVWAAATAGREQTPGDMMIFSFLSNVPGLVVGCLYFGIFESSSWQATPGKKILGLQVTSLDGDRISFLRASGRFFGKILSGMICLVGYFMAGFTPKKQALHDMIAGCLVVRG